MEYLAFAHPDLAGAVDPGMARDTLHTVAPGHGGEIDFETFVVWFRAMEAGLPDGITGRMLASL